MTVIYRSGQTPTYTLLSTDISGETGQAIGCIQKGATCFVVDTGAWKIVADDLVLEDYSLPVSVTVPPITVDAIEISQATPGTTNGVATGVSAAGSDGIGNHMAVITAPGSVNSAPLGIIPLVFNGTSFDRLRGDATNGMKVQGPITDTQLRSADVKITLDGETVAVGSIAAGDNNIGNVDLASAIPVGSNVIGGTKDAGEAWTSSHGVSGVPVNSADMTTAAAVTDAPTAGQKLVITDIIISTDTAMNVLLEEETSGTDIFPKFFMAANSTIQITPRSKTKLPTADKKLTAKTSVAGNISILPYYYSEA